MVHFCKFSIIMPSRLQQEASAGSLSSMIDLPVYAVFIGANFGLASLAFVHRILNNILADAGFVLCMFFFLGSCLLCIVGSSLLAKNSVVEGFAFCFLTVGYVFVAILSLPVFARRAVEVRERNRVIGG
jgi:hypothetical protein